MGLFGTLFCEKMGCFDCFSCVFGQVFGPGQHVAAFGAQLATLSTRREQIP